MAFSAKELEKIEKVVEGIKSGRIDPELLCTKREEHWCGPFSVDDFLE